MAMQIAIFDGSEVKNKVQTKEAKLMAPSTVVRCPSHRKDSEANAIILITLSQLAKARAKQYPITQYAKFGCGCVHKVSLQPVVLPMHRKES